MYGVFALFFALSAVLPMLEQKGFVTQVLYENAPTVLSFAPFFAVGLFACLKGFRSIGRICDLALPVFVVCYAVLMLLALPYADLSELLPAGQNGAGILRGWVYGLTRYTDCLYPLFFLGHFDYEKGGTAKMMGAFAFGTAAAMFFLAVFYGIFSDIAVLQQNALAQVSKYTTAFTLLGRVDLIFIIAMTLLLVFAMCVPLQMCTHCVCESLRCKPALPAFALNLLMLALAVMLNYSFREVQTLYAEKLWIVFAVLCYAVPAAALLLRRKRKGEKK